VIDSSEDAIGRPVQNNSTRSLLDQAKAAGLVNVDPRLEAELRAIHSSESDADRSEDMDAPTLSVGVGLVVGGILWWFASQAPR